MSEKPNLFTEKKLPDHLESNLRVHAIYECPHGIRVLVILGTMVITPKRLLPTLLCGGVEVDGFPTEEIAAFISVLNASGDATHWRGFTPECETIEDMRLLSSSEFDNFSDLARTGGQHIENYLEDEYTSHIDFFGKEYVKVISCDSVTGMWNKIGEDLVGNLIPTINEAFNPKLSETLGDLALTPEELIQIGVESSRVRFAESYGIDTYRIDHGTNLVTTDDEVPMYEDCIQMPLRYFDRMVSVVDSNMLELMNIGKDLTKDDVLYSGPEQSPEAALHYEALVGLSKCLALEELGDMLDDTEWVLTKAAEDIIHKGLKVSVDVTSLTHEEVISELEKRSK